jgi:hypothetical protein
MAIGNNLQEALASLLSQNALNIEINRTDDIQGLIQSIIQTNKNLSESTQNNNWEMVGTDLNELQTLINSLEKLLEEQEDVTKNNQEVQTYNQNPEENASVSE